ncbi:MAG: hypothetical protein KKG94_02965 [Nanoarchaeota archaeon]|nr:hypothetical protein [Nanoarchaeota archaeon]
MKKWVLMLGLVFLLVFGIFVYEFNFKQDFMKDNANPPSINDLFVDIYFFIFGLVIIILIFVFFFALMKRKK